MLILYKDKILDIRAGDTILFRSEFIWRKPVTYLSAIIRGVTRFKYNHCGTVVDNDGVLYINEALAGGITQRPLEKHLEREKSFIMVLRPIEPVDVREFSMLADTLLGYKYDVWALIHHLVYRLPKTFLGTGRWIGSTGEHATTKMVCSEYSAWTYGIPDWWTFSAADLARHPAFRTVFREK